MQRSTSIKLVLTIPGVEREMKICHHQPHLVPPMKLVLYEDMPSTPRLPPPSQISQLVAQGRNLASRASDRASLSIRKRSSSRPKVSAPRLRTADELPSGRLQQYRPLELSIYMPENRLSDLPEFDAANFNIFGEIQLPPNALIHSRSEEHLGHSPNDSSLPRKPTTSMVGERQLAYWQERSRSSSIISTSRPPSAHDTFHSHPVAFNTLPGIPPHQTHTRQPTQVTTGLTVLSPMQEEFTPTSQEYVDTLEFPHIEGEEAALPSPAQAPIPAALQQPKPVVLTVPPPAELPAPPFKLSRPPTAHSYRSRSTHSQTNSFNRNRVSQWISRSASSASDGGHEIKKAQFYQCTTSSIDHPTPQPFASQHSRQRTMSASTVDTGILSDDASASASLTSMTTAPTTVHESVRSRSNTIKSFGATKPVVVVAVEEELQFEEVLPPSYAEAHAVALGGVQTVKVPGIGMAF